MILHPELSWKLLRSQIEDQPNPDNGDELQPSQSPLDYLTPGMLAGGAKAGVQGLANMGEEGALKLPWRNVKRVIGDLDPNQYTKSQWGRMFRDATGENVRMNANEFLGAQAMDELKSSSDPRHIIGKTLSKEGYGGINPNVSVELGSAGDQTLGYYSPMDRKIVIDTERIHHVPSKNKDLYLAGVSRHEGTHAKDYLMDPRTFDKKNLRNLLSLGKELRHGEERFLERPMSTEFLRGGGFLSEDSGAKDAIIEHALENPAFRNMLPKNLLEPTDGELAKIVRQAYGTKSTGGSGFSGVDPYLIDRLQSGNHFTGIDGNLHLPVDYMLKEELRHGAEINPVWWTDEMESLKDQYKSHAWRKIKK